MNNSDFNLITRTFTYALKADMPPLPPGYPISANIVLDSVSPSDKRITTFELVFPRYVLAEFNTHRALSRNASSSRAIPTKKLIQNALDNFVEPVRYGKNQPGMQASKENLEGEALNEARHIWYHMAKTIAEGCQRLTDLGLHKQWASRPVEWFSTIKVVMTATEFDNLFLLRDHPEAQDEICYLIQAVKVAMNESTPQRLEIGQWHTPYVSWAEAEELGLENALKVSAARCARTSYKTVHGVTSTLDEDLSLFSRLVHDLGDEDNPFHASPTEHQATPRDVNQGTRLTGNFVGWKQFRKYLELGIPISGVFNS